MEIIGLVVFCLWVFYVWEDMDVFVRFEYYDVNGECIFVLGLIGDELLVLMVVGWLCVLYCKFDLVCSFFYWFWYSYDEY